MSNAKYVNAYIRKTYKEKKVLIKKDMWDKVKIYLEENDTNFNELVNKYLKSLIVSE